MPSAEPKDCFLVRYVLFIDGMFYLLVCLFLSIFFFSLALADLICITIPKFFTFPAVFSFFLMQVQVIWTCYFIVKKKLVLLVMWFLVGHSLCSLNKILKVHFLLWLFIQRLYVFCLDFLKKLKFVWCCFTLKISFLTYLFCLCHEAQMNVHVSQSFFLVVNILVPWTI